MVTFISRRKIDETSIGSYVYGNLIPRFAEYLPCTSLREATIAATMIHWLGSNGGREFLRVAAIFEKADELHAAPTLVAWCLKNTFRGPGLGDVRLLETLMNPYTKPGDQDYWRIDLEDCDTSERIAQWLSSPDGKRLLAEGETEVSIREDAEKHYRIRRII